MICSSIDLVSGLGAAGLATSCGVGISLWAPWSARARQAGLPCFFGMALGPFLAGAALILTLLILPGYGRGVHLAVWTLFLASLAVALFLWHPRQENTTAKFSWSWSEVALVVLLVACIAGLSFNVLAFPLTQNDALEYAIVGREIFQAGTLKIYPIVDPVLSVSGFYGPWTHPPLYVVLIYLSSLLQGHADTPGLMRLISPWFLVTATGLVVGMGHLVSLRAGLLAGLIFISTPLIYLGAGSALIDPLPVCGLALILALLSGLPPEHRLRWAWLGLGLGLALWTHSQAILLIPLTLVAQLAQYSFREWRAAGKAALGMLSVASSIAAWPFWHNLVIFGTPISDNPQVFALPSLDWAGYFRIVRGLDHATALVQYGVLKGWFALEAYGFTFWLALAGIIFVAAHWGKQFSGRWQSGQLFREIGPLALLIWFGYLVGVVLSIVVGSDLMIKNERYLLVILPSAALLAGIGLDRLFETKLILCGMIALLTFGYSVQLCTLTIYRMKHLRIGPTDLRLSEKEMLMRRPEYQAIAFLNSDTTSSGLVLSLKPSDMYYSSRRMVSFLDPAMIPFYKIDDAVVASRWLIERGITHVHIPDYGIPPFYNSVLNKLLFDPELTRLVFSSEGFQVYSLDPHQKKVREPFDISPRAVEWKKTTGLLLGGHKALVRWGAGKPELLRQDGCSDSGLPVGLFHRAHTTELRSSDLRAQGEVGLSLRLSGRGFVRVWVEQVNGRFLLGDFFLRSNSSRTWSRRWITTRGHDSIRLVIEQVGRCRICLDEVTLWNTVPEK